MIETHDNRDFICDDRNVLEDVRKIRTMSDEEFDQYMQKLKKQDADKQQ